MSSEAIFQEENQKKDIIQPKLGDFSNKNPHYEGS